MIALRYFLLFAFAAAGVNSGAAEPVQKQSTGPYVIELRVSPRQEVLETPMFFTITTADGRPVPTSGAKGRAKFSSGRLKGVATLHPDGANRMKGYGLMSAKPDLSIEVSVVIPDAPPLKASFKPLQ